jgi:hypothetical protein
MTHFMQPDGIAAKLGDQRGLMTATQRGFRGL